jgi:hypothetical protein
MSVATGLLVVGIVSGNHWLPVVDLAYDHDATANQARLYLFLATCPAYLAGSRRFASSIRPGRMHLTAICVCVPNHNELKGERSNADLKREKPLLSALLSVLAQVQ